MTQSPAPLPVSHADDDTCPIPVIPPQDAPLAPFRRQAGARLVFLLAAVVVTVLAGASWAMAGMPVPEHTVSRTVQVRVPGPVVVKKVAVPGPVRTRTVTRTVAVPGPVRTVPVTIACVDVSGRVFPARDAGALGGLRIDQCVMSIGDAGALSADGPALVLTDYATGDSASFPLAGSHP